MRIMIFGDVASGKSTISDRLGAKLDLPVIHLDEAMAKLGREQKAHIREYIQGEADKADWIIEGNAFTKDQSYRMERADVVIVFSSHRLLAFIRHVRRALRVRRGKEKKMGGVTGDLKLNYYIPYVLWNFPKRREAAVERAEKLGKRIVRVKSFQQGVRLLERQF